MIRFSLALLILITTNAYPHAGDKTPYVNLLQDPEVKILGISDHVYVGEFDAAETELNELIAENPDFRLAHLLYSELMTVRSGLGPGFGDWSSPGDDELSSLIDEIRRRHAHRMEVSAYTEGKIPDSLLQLSPSQKQVIIVDSTLSRAHVFENINNQLSLIGDYYITVGKNGLLKNMEGDGRTPMGVYFITSRLDPIGLDDLYGDGALPLNYPNEWDQRLGRSGFGIWLHGVPSNTYNRAPFATEGCVAFPNDDITLLYNMPNIENTPVLITQRINWVEKAQNTRFSLAISRQIEAWRNDWVSGDINQIRQYYARSFSDGNMDRETWLRTQKKVLDLSASNKFELSDISMFKYPGVSGLVVVSFNKEHLTNIASERSRIRQYWAKVGGEEAWTIVYEGPAEYQPVHFKGIPEAVRPTLADEVRIHPKHVKQARGS